MEVNSNEGRTEHVPVPHESTLSTTLQYGEALSLVSDWKTPSAMVDRQMLPRQTKRTDIF